MIDDETRILLGAFSDGELSPGEALAMERRLAREPDLRTMLDELDALSTALRALPAPLAPATLRARIAREITAPPRRSDRRTWRALAAAALVGLATGTLVGGGGVYLGMPSATVSPVDALLAAHLRALAAPQPFDIASSDRHVVKPWFNGRTPIAPDAPDLADQGFPLVGGRIDVVGQAAVPALVYRHDRHVISVTILPRTANDLPAELRRGGTTIEHWHAGDLTYWVASDLNATDLGSFVQIFRARTAPAG